MKLAIVVLALVALAATVLGSGNTIKDAKIRGDCRKCLLKCVKARKDALLKWTPKSPEISDLNGLLALLKNKRKVKKSKEPLDKLKPVLDYTPCFKSYWHAHCFSECPTLVSLWNMMQRFKRRGLHLAVGYRRMHAFDYKQLGLAVPAEVAAHDAKLAATTSTTTTADNDTAEANANDGKKKHKKQHQKAEQQKLAVAEATKTN